MSSICVYFQTSSSYRLSPSQLDSFERVALLLNYIWHVSPLHIGLLARPRCPPSQSPRGERSAEAVFDEE